MFLKSGFLKSRVYCTKMEAMSAKLDYNKKQKGKAGRSKKAHIEKPKLSKNTKTPKWKEDIKMLKEQNALLNNMYDTAEATNSTLATESEKQLNTANKINEIEQEKLKETLSCLSTERMKGKHGEISKEFSSLKRDNAEIKVELEKEKAKNIVLEAELAKKKNKEPIHEVMVVTKLHNAALPLENIKPPSVPLENIQSDILSLENRQAGALPLDKINIQPLSFPMEDIQTESEKNLKNHISSVHEGNKPFECEICDYTYTRPDGTLFFLIFTYLRGRSH